MKSVPNAFFNGDSWKPALQTYASDGCDWCPSVLQHTHKKKSNVIVSMTNLKCTMNVAFDSNSSTSIDSTEHICWPDNILIEICGWRHTRPSAKTLKRRSYRTILHACPHQHNPEVVEHIIITILMCHIWYNTLCVSFNASNNAMKAR